MIITLNERKNRLWDGMRNVSDGTTIMNSKRINITTKTCYNSELAIHENFNNTNVI